MAKTAPEANGDLFAGLEDLPSGRGEAPVATEPVARPTAEGDQEPAPEPAPRPDGGSVGGPDPIVAEVMDAVASGDVPVDWLAAPAGPAVTDGRAVDGETAPSAPIEGAALAALAPDEWASAMARLVEWERPRKVGTRRGERQLLTAAPTAAFTAGARDRPGRLRRAGFALSDVRVEVCWWRDPDEPLPDGLRFRPAQDEIRIADLLEWGPALTVTTQRGPRRMLKASPTPAFMDLWRRRGRDLRKAGLTVSAGRDGEPVVKWWNDYRVDAAAVQASREAAGEAAGLRVPKGLAYLPYQAAGIRYALGRDSVLIADEMGLGKTIEAIGVLNNDAQAKRALILCPTSLLRNWMAEVRKWQVERAGLHEVKKARRIPSGRIVAFATYSMAGKLEEKLCAETWDLCVYDEAHFLKNEAAARTTAALAVPARRRLFLTGTPVLSRPLELWPILHAISPDEWGGKLGFAKRYCGAHQKTINKAGDKVWDMSGATNLDELQQRLRGTCMVRRRKADVLTELPPKRRQVFLLNASAPNLARRAEGVSLKALAAAFDAGGGYHLPEFSQIAEALAEAGRAKAPAVGRQVAEMLESIDKVVVFAHHHAVLDEIAASLAAAGVKGAVQLTGLTPPARRQGIVERFQSDPKCRVLLGSIGAAGVGLTMTAAADVVFAELPWRPSDVTQAEDRCHRLGQSRAVNVRHLVLPGTLDEHVCRLLVEKQEVALAALDAEVDWGLAGGAAADQLVLTLPPERARRLAPAAAAEAGRACLAALDAVCDGVRSQDGAGFSALTAARGTALLGLGEWTHRDLRAAAWVCTVHRKQLDALGAAPDGFLDAASEALDAPLGAGPSAR